jgi:hypothetical protein
MHTARLVISWLPLSGAALVVPENPIPTDDALSFPKTCRSRLEETIPSPKLRSLNRALENGELLSEGQVLCGKRGSALDQDNE